MAYVSFTVGADTELRRTVGLRAQVTGAILGVLETALELRRLGSGNLHSDAPLVMQVGSYVVAYSLHLEQESATIWRAERVQQSGGPRGGAHRTPSGDALV
jgi:hypothetical protein